MGVINFELTWMHNAACRDSNLHIVAAERPGNKRKAEIRAAIIICRGCPVLRECRDWARAVDRNGTPWTGVVVGGYYYGSTSPYRRREQNQNLQEV